MRTKYQQNQQCQFQDQQAKLITELKQIISRQDSEITKLVEEKNNYKIQLGQKIPKEYRRKGGGGSTIAVQTNCSTPEINHENSQIVSSTPNRELDVIWETNDSTEDQPQQATSNQQHHGSN